MSRPGCVRPLVVLEGMDEAAHQLLNDLDRYWREDVATVSSVHHALARVALTPPVSAFSTVLVSLEATSGHPAAIAAAFRRLDPSLRLVLVVPPGARELPGTPPRIGTGETMSREHLPEPHASAARHARALPEKADSPDVSGGHAARREARALGYDDALEIPAGESELRRALGDLRPIEVEPPEVAVRAEHHQSTNVRETATRTDPVGAVEPVRGPAVPEATTAVSSERTSVRDAAPHAAPVGTPAPPDLDLLDGLVQGDSIVERAVEEIRRRTGWRQVTFDPTSRERPEEGASIVAFRGRRFGVLKAPGAPAPLLDAWARWLGAWLAIDARQQRLHELAYTDELTGAGNRRSFDRFMEEAIEGARRERRMLHLMVFDIDDFKYYNDRFGHLVGDEVLRETVKLLRSVIRRGDRVFRIGGDEFAVVFADPEGPREAGSKPLESIETIASRFQRQVCDLKFPSLGERGPGPLSVSAGLATFPWDGHDAASLVDHADRLALESKRRGKNALTFGPGARAACGRSAPPGKEVTGPRDRDDEGERGPACVPE